MTVAVHLEKVWYDPETNEFWVVAGRYAHTLHFTDVGGYVDENTGSAFYSGHMLIEDINLKKDYGWISLGDL